MTSELADRMGTFDFYIVVGIVGSPYIFVMVALV